jgi:hypothetical protein
MQFAWRIALTLSFLCGTEPHTPTYTDYQRREDGMEKAGDGKK